MMKYIYTLVAPIFLFGFTTPDSKHSITITVNGFRNNKGQIAIGLYNKKSQYYDNPWKSHVEKKTDAKNKTLTFTIADVPKGKYVITLLDDENSNDKMDYAWYGFPKEGYGFSNNKKPSILGAPSFESCRFNVNGDTNISLKVQYWIN